MKDAAIQAQRDQWIRNIEPMLNRIPPGHSNWSYDRTVAYKKVVQEAQQAVKSSKATTTKLQTIHNQLQAYFN